VNLTPRQLGGFGSGRRGGSKRDTVEDYRSIDVNRLHKRGWLRPGRTSALYWARDNEGIASINIRSEGDRVRLSYRTQIGGEWQDLEETIRIERVPCRLGGERPYFLCPGVVNGIACKRRICKLYAASHYFLCRYCYRLPYASQSDDAQGRHLRRASKLWRRLGEDPHIKPKGMWRRTYERLREKAVAAESLANEGFEGVAERFMARFEKKLARRKKG
jgi:hypothetical protein